MGLPCFKTLDCWYIHFNVVEYLRAELSAAEWESSFEKVPAPKIVSLAELIQKAQKLAEKQKAFVPVTTANLCIGFLYNQVAAQQGF